MKRFNIQYNVGSAKYLVNFNNEVNTHKDGSAFWNIRIFKNKKDMGNFIKQLKTNGYKE